jgi:hypothetical protein
MQSRRERLSGRRAQQRYAGKLPTWRECFRAHRRSLGLGLSVFAGLSEVSGSVRKAAAESVASSVGISITARFSRERSE